MNEAEFITLGMSNNMKEYKVKSLTDKSKEYTVTYFDETDKWVCTCPSYVFHFEGFECKHIKKIKQGGKK